MQPLLNTDQMCEYLNIKKRRLAKYLAEDETFPAFKVGGRWKADPDELQAWVRQHPGPGETKVVNFKQRRKRRQTRPQRPPGGWKLTLPD